MCCAAGGPKQRGAMTTYWNPWNFELKINLFLYYKWLSQVFCHGSGKLTDIDALCLDIFLILLKSLHGSFLSLVDDSIYSAWDLVWHKTTLCANAFLFTLSYVCCILYASSLSSLGSSIIHSTRLPLESYSHPLPAYLIHHALASAPHTGKQMTVEWSQTTACNARGPKWVVG